MQGRLLDSRCPARRLLPSISTRSSDPTSASSIVGLTVVALIAILVAALLMRRVGRLERRLGVLTRGEDGRSLEDVLGCPPRPGARRLAARSTTWAGARRRLETSARSALQRVGIVRYNPFEETGGNQSFALALLDADDHGIIISSLHARSGTRVYAKAVTSGRPAGALSDEEAEALRARPGRDEGPARDRRTRASRDPSDARDGLAGTATPDAPGMVLDAPSPRSVHSSRSPAAAAASG